MRSFPAALGALVLCGIAGAGCGKKGPPLAPIVRIPAAVDRVNARRVGDDVYLTFTVPAQNVDASKPADIRRVEVYGATATTPPPRTRFLEIAELVGTVPVAPPPSPNGEKPRAESAATAKEDAGAAVQGAIVTLRDTLSQEDLAARELPALPTANTRRTPLAAPVIERRGELRRFYFTMAYSARGRVSLSTIVTELPLTPLPEAPLAIEVTYDSTTTTISWEPSGGLIGFLLNSALPFEPPPIDELAPFRGLVQSPSLPQQPGLPVQPQPGAPPAGVQGAAPIGTIPGSQTQPPGAPVQEPVASAPDAPETTRYNVYRELELDPLLLPELTESTDAERGPPQPLNPMPLDALVFTDDVEFERERCYVIRAVRGTAGSSVEGRGSERRCVKPVDVFPPAAPVGLSAVTAAGAISLIWEANAEDDVAGYLILRGSTTDATLLPLTHAPIAETQFIDRTVSAGERYVYAVVAVDNRVPVPNVSQESMRVEETAR